jgi:hypothetical protein
MYQVFLSLVVVVKNQAWELEVLVAEAASKLNTFVCDYELIVVDNASTDGSIEVLKKLTSEGGHPNLQVYALTKSVEADIASWVGLESALGDFIAVIDPSSDDIGFLPDMLKKAVSGLDVVFASNDQKPELSWAYLVARVIFNNFYKRFNGINLTKEAPQYRMLSKRVINFILQHPQSAMAYRHLPATGGFAKANLSYSAKPRSPHRKRLWESVERSMRLIVATTGAPIRLVNALCLFGAGANLIYSLYVVLIGLFKPYVAPGWVSLSLQQSGMFFLLSLVLLVLGEYILNLASVSNEGPLYHIAQEFTSAHVTRREKLNIEEVASKSAQQPSKFSKLVSDDKG